MSLSTPLEVKFAGEPVLREMARKLAPEKIRSLEIQQHVENTRDTMHRAPAWAGRLPEFHERDAA